MTRDFLRQVPGEHGSLARGPTVWQRLRIDVPLLLLLLLLVAYGLIVLYSGSGKHIEMVERQALFFLTAFGLMLAIAQIPPPMLKRYSVFFYIGGVILLVLVELIGVGAKGAVRWLELPGLPRFQPSELMKLAMPMTVAWFLSDRHWPPNYVHVLATLALIAVPAVLILEQPDLGTSILVSASGIFALLLAGLRWRYIIGAVVALGASLYPIWHVVLREYQRKRVLMMLDPEADKFGAGWNIIQSKAAIGSGGWDGKGWLDGTQSQLDFLPESHTDFIIAVMAEEFGLRGVLFLLAIYVAIILRGLYIGVAAKSAYSRLLAGSLTLTFFVYVFVNMGMVSGLLPVVGVPLPLISYGGTAVITLMAGFGILMSIQAEEHRFRR
jgi:rod shape determining protein RodA